MSNFIEGPGDEVGFVHMPAPLVSRRLGQMVSGEIVFLDPDCLDAGPDDGLYLSTNYPFTEQDLTYRKTRDGDVAIGYFAELTGSNVAWSGHIVDMRRLKAGEVAVCDEDHLRNNAETLVRPLGIIYNDMDGQVRYQSSLREATLEAAGFMLTTIDGAITSVEAKKRKPTKSTPRPAKPLSAAPKGESK